MYCLMVSEAGVSGQSSVVPLWQGLTPGYSKGGHRDSHLVCDQVTHTAGGPHALRLCWLGTSVPGHTGLSVEFLSTQQPG